jgi:hypothetical protein
MKRPSNKPVFIVLQYAVTSELYVSALGEKFLNTRSRCKDLWELTLKNIHMDYVHVNLIFRRVRKILKSDY